MSSEGARAILDEAGRFAMEQYCQGQRDGLEAATLMIRAMTTPAENMTGSQVITTALYVFEQAKKRAEEPQ